MKCLNNFLELQAAHAECQRLIRCLELVIGKCDEARNDLLPIGCELLASEFKEGDEVRLKVRAATGTAEVGRIGLVAKLLKFGPDVHVFRNQEMMDIISDAKKYVMEEE